jgi:two-component system response regulator YesN
MYTVALVDDEPWNLKGFTHLSDWASHGFSIAYSASRSTEALEYLKRNRVDVLFADIKMPKVNGLELIRGINARERGIICVVISGYAEFEYAQAALQEGVFDYCLKPVNGGKLDETLDRIRELLDARALSSQTIEEFSELTFDKLDEMMSRQSPTKRRFLQGALCDIGLGEAIGAIEGIRFAHCRAGKNMRLYLVNTDRSLSLSLASGEKTVGLSGLWSYDETIDPYALHREASCAHAEMFIRQAPGVYSYSKGNPFEAGRIVEPILAAMKAMDREAIAKWFEGLPGFCSSNGLSMQDLEVVWNQVAGCAMQLFPENVAGAAIDYLDYTQMLAQYPSLRAFSQHMGAQVLQLAGGSPATHKLPQSEQSLIGKVNHYIAEHYSEDLSIKSLALAHFVNPNYLSSLFAKRNGVPFTSYINNLRIEKSKTLLLETARTINDIAQAAGFSDYFYFNKVFKKLTGTTPAKFRRGGDE